MEYRETMDNVVKSTFERSEVIIANNPELAGVVKLPAKSPDSLFEALSVLKNEESIHLGDILDGLVLSEIEREAGSHLMYYTELPELDNESILRITKRLLKAADSHHLLQSGHDSEDPTACTFSTRMDTKNYHVYLIVKVIRGAVNICLKQTLIRQSYGWPVLTFKQEALLPEMTETLYDSGSYKKFTKVLNSLEFSQADLKNFSNLYNNVDREYRLVYTDQYIPEHYIHMQEKLNLDSCMSHTSDHYDLHGEGNNGEDLHPVMCYENSPNMALGLLLDVSKLGSDYPFIARFITHTSRACYPRVYGDEKSERILRKSGLECGHTQGGILQAIDCNGDWLLPYLDGDVENATESEHHGETVLKIAEYGDLVPDYESGRAKVSLCECPICGYDYDISDGAYEVMDAYREYVPTCYDCYASSVEINGESVASDCATECVDGDYAFDNEVTYSSYEGGYIQDDYAEEDEEQGIVYQSTAEMLRDEREEARLLEEEES